MDLANDQDTELYTAFRQFDPDKSGYFQTLFFRVLKELFKRLETYPSIQDGNIDAAEIETMLRTNPAVDKAEIDEFLKTFANR